MALWRLARAAAHPQVRGTGAKSRFRGGQSSGDPGAKRVGDARLGPDRPAPATRSPGAQLAVASTSAMTSFDQIDKALPIVKLTGFGAIRHPPGAGAGAAGRATWRRVLFPDACPTRNRLRSPTAHRP